MITHYQLSIMTCRVIYKSHSGWYKVLLLENIAGVRDFVFESNPQRIEEDINIHSFCGTLNKP